MIMIQNKPMGEILKRMELMEFLEIIIFDETMILNDPIDSWPICDCLISFHSKGISWIYWQARDSRTYPVCSGRRAEKMRTLGSIGPRNR